MISSIKALLNDRPRVLVAIDGGAASGKSTIGAQVAQALGGNLVHMDDFFLPFDMRTHQRLSTPGGNVHWERFLAEVLTPMQQGLAFEYRAFDCGTGQMGAPVAVQPRQLSIVEGVYSLHPRLAHAYDLKFFLRIHPAEQERRIRTRNPQEYQRFLDEWIPMENQYFQAFGIEQSCHKIIEVK